MTSYSIMKNLVLENSVYEPEPLSELKAFTNSYSRCFKSMDTLEQQLNTQRSKQTVLIRRLLYRNLMEFQERLDESIRTELPHYWLPLKAETQLRKQQLRLRRKRDREAKRNNRIK